MKSNAEVIAQVPQLVEFLNDTRLSRFGSAGVATTLRDIIAFEPESKIRILGFDGANVEASTRPTQPTYPWVEILGEWLSGNAELSYLFLMPTASTKRELRNARLAHKNLDAYVLDTTVPVPDASDRDFLALFRIFHFALFSG